MGEVSMTQLNTQLIIHCSGNERHECRARGAVTANPVREVVVPVEVREGFLEAVTLRHVCRNLKVREAG